MLMALIAVFPAIAITEYTAAFAGADQMLWPQRGLLWLVSLAAFGAAAIGGEVFVIRPIRTLRLSLDRLAAGDFSARAQLAPGAPGLKDLGSAVNAMATALETRERDRADAVLRTLSTALEQTPDNVFITDRDGRIEYVNAAFETLTGYARAEAIGQTPRILKAPGKYTQDFYEKLWQTILGGGVFEAVLLNQKKNGEVYYEEKTIAPVRDGHGTITHFVSTGKDITERQRAAAALKASEAKFRLVMENTPSAIFIHRGNTFVYVNTAAERLTGYSRDELLSMPFWQMVHPDSRDLVRDRGLARQRGDDVPARYELQISTKAGEERWIDITAARTLFDGEWSELATIFDITQQKEAVQALLTSEAQLRQSQKMEAVGQLAGGIAHDFNNLLTVIHGYAEFLAASLPEAGQHRADVHEITRAAERAATLTRQLLAFSRKQILAPRVLRLGDVVAELTPMLRRLISEAIDLRTITTESGQVKVDAGQLEQVLMNLAVNARDAMPTGGRLTIETADVSLDEHHARHHPSTRPGPHVVLAVSDTGHGMDAATQSRVFEPFFTTKPQGQGTGLGLATVYGIVKQSGGHIWVYSEVGRGTTFKVYLPRTEEPAQAVPARPVAVSNLRGTETVLLIEDEDMVRHFVEKVLSRHGYTVHAFADPERAIAFARSHRATIHLILSDVVLPGMNGRMLATELLRQHPESKVLYMSGYTNDAVVHHGVLEVGTWFVPKPFTAHALVQRVRDILDSSIAPI